MRIKSGLNMRHPSDTLTVEDWEERVADYRERNLTEMLKYSQGKLVQARKAGRYRKEI